MKKTVVTQQASQVEHVEAYAERDEMTTLHAAANAAVSRGGSRQRVETRTESRFEVAETHPKKVFKGFGSWGNFMPQREDAAPVAANESAFELADFGRDEPVVDTDANLKGGALDLVIDSGVDLDDVLNASDLERIARCSRDGASARRRAVIDAAPGAVTRISRYMKRNTSAHDTAANCSRPDLAEARRKRKRRSGRAYLLIGAALADQLRWLIHAASYASPQLPMLPSRRRAN